MSTAREDKLGKIKHPEVIQVIRREVIAEIVPDEFGEKSMGHAAMEAAAVYVLEESNIGEGISVEFATAYHTFRVISEPLIG